MDFNVVLVGAGNMGGAMLRGWIADGLSVANISVLDPSPSQEMKSYLDEQGISCFSTTDSIPAPHVMVLAVKPQLMDAVLPDVSKIVVENTVENHASSNNHTSRGIHHIEDPTAICSWCTESLSNNPTRGFSNI